MSVAQVIALRQGLEAIKQQQASSPTQSPTQPSPSPAPAATQAQPKPAVYYTRTPTGIDYGDKVLTVTRNEGAPNSQVMTKEQKSAVLLELTKINAAPSTNEEAIARGESTYIPEEQKQAYRNELNNYLNSPSRTVTINVTPKSQSGSPTLSNDLFSGKRQGLSLPFLDMGTNQPVIKNNEQRLEAVATLITLPFGGGAAQIAKNAVIGGGLNVGMNYVVTGKATPETFVEGAIGGIVLGGIGGKALQALKIGNQGLKPVIAKIGVNSALGAGGSAAQEYITTQQITPENVLYGGAFGAGLAVFGEVGGKVASRLVPKVQTRITNNQRVLEQLDVTNTKYEQALSQNKPYRPSFKEKVAMKVAGVQPIEPAQSVVELPTIPTAPTKAYVTETKIRFKNGVTDDVLSVPKSRTSKEVLDEALSSKPINKPNNISIENYKIEMETPENIRLIPKMQAGLEIADFAEANSIMFGKSQSPEVYYAKSETPVAKQLPQYDIKQGQMTERKPETSFKKSPQENRVDQMKMRDNTLRDVTFNADLFPEVSNSGMSTAEASAIRKAQSKTPAQTPKQVMDELNKSWLVDNQKSGSVIQELTQGVKAEPTGAEKVISDIKAGRVIDTGRTSILQQSNNSIYTVAPIQKEGREQRSQTIYKTGLNLQPSGFTSRNQRIPFPGTQRARAVEEEETYLSYPNSILPQPVLKEKVRRDTITGQGVIPGLLSGLVPFSKNKGSLTSINSQSFTQGVKPIIQDRIATRIEERPISAIAQAPISIQKPIESPVEVTITPETPTFNFSSTRGLSGYIPTSKLDLGPTRAMDNPKFIGIGKRVRYYAVADPLNVAGELL